MSDLKEMAEAYATVMRCLIPQTDEWKIAVATYLTGAQVMQVRAATIATNGNGSDAADCAMNIANQIQSIPTE